jgi:uncharacterized iron-regulated membrane protein
VGRALSARRAVFWLHFAAGTAVGLPVLLMSLTGLALSLRPAALALETRGLGVSSCEPAARPPLDALAARAAAAAPPGSRLVAVSLRAEARAPAVFSYTGDLALLVDPCTGAVLRPGWTRARRFLRAVEDWHRRLARVGPRRAAGERFSRAAALALLVLALSGPLLWLRRPLGTTLWSWHNAAGIWGAPLLLVTALTGLGMSLRLGEGPAEKTQAPAGREAGAASLEALKLSIDSLSPGWSRLELRLPEGGPARASVFSPDRPGSAPSTAVLDRATARALRWQPASKLSGARRLRSWLKPIHTGEAAGAAGEAAAAASAGAALTLALTGLQLAARRLRRGSGA